MLKSLVERIVKMQQDKVAILTGQKYYPVDIRLTNGNIVLRSFRIVALEKEKIKGITWKEEYSAPREQREIVYSYFDLDEIASLICEELEIVYEKEITNRS